MDLSTAQRLAALNQEFYAQHAENFADARPRLAAGVQRVLAGIAPGARVLEVGCGDGKVGRALARQGVANYLGLDSSAAMLARAKTYTTKDEGPLHGTELEAAHSGLRSPSPVFQFADLTSPSWSASLPAQPFDWALAFAVLHHLPGYALRAATLQTLAEHLAPGGRVALSNWVFTRSDRLKKRVVPWAQAGLNANDVEPGDYLLSWERRGQRGLRYVHVLEMVETTRLAAQAGLRIVETYSADGVTGDLSDYTVMTHAG